MLKSTGVSVDKVIMEDDNLMRKRMRLLHRISAAVSSKSGDSSKNGNSTSLDSSPSSSDFLLATSLGLSLQIVTALGPSNPTLVSAACGAF